MMRLNSIISQNIEEMQRQITRQKRVGEKQMKLSKSTHSLTQNTLKDLQEVQIEIKNNSQALIQQKISLQQLEQKKTKLMDSKYRQDVDDEILRLNIQIKDLKIYCSSKIQGIKPKLLSLLKIDEIKVKVNGKNDSQGPKSKPISNKTSLKHPLNLNQLKILQKIGSQETKVKILTPIVVMDKKQQIDQSVHISEELDIFVQRNAKLTDKLRNLRDLINLLSQKGCRVDEKFYRLRQYAQDNKICEQPGMDNKNKQLIQQIATLEKTVIMCQSMQSLKIDQSFQNNVQVQILLDSQIQMQCDTRANICGEAKQQVKILRAKIVDMIAQNESFQINKYRLQNSYTQSQYQIGNSCNVNDKTIETQQQQIDLFSNSIMAVQPYMEQISSKKYLIKNHHKLPYLNQSQDQQQYNSEQQSLNSNIKLDEGQYKRIKSDPNQIDIINEKVLPSQSQIDETLKQKAKFKISMDQKVGSAYQKVQQTKKNQDKLDKDRLYLDNYLQTLEQEQQNKIQCEQDNLNQLKLEQDKLEQDKQDQIKLEQNKLDQEKMILDQQVQAKLEQTQFEQNKIEQAKLEQDKIDQQRINQEIIELKKEQEKIDQEKIQQEKIEQEKIEQEKIGQEKIGQEKIEQQKIEQEKIAQKKIEQQKIEQEKIEQEKIELEKIEQEKIEQEKIEAIIQTKLLQDKLIQDKIQQAQIEEQRIAKLEQEQLFQAQLLQAKQQQEELELEQEKFVKAKLLQDKMNQIKLDQAKLEQDKLDQDNSDRLKIELDKIEQEKIKKARLEQALIDKKIQMEQKQLQEEVAQLERDLEQLNQFDEGQLDKVWHEQTQLEIDQIENEVESFAANSYLGNVFVQIFLDNQTMVLQQDDEDNTQIHEESKKELRIATAKKLLQQFYNEEFNKTQNQVIGKLKQSYVEIFNIIVISDQELVQQWLAKIEKEQIADSMYGYKYLTRQIDKWVENRKK